MNQKTMGQFIAILRKANGLTQQDVAERLNVSNKSVSRWERDESAPDITLIPALAEMFDVTCDELLKGERIIYDDCSQKREPKVEKQLKAMVNHSISNFKTLIYIAFTISLVGFICMVSISYGFNNDFIGFLVELLFITIAFILTLIAINKMKALKTDNELFETADSMLLENFNNTLGKYGFYSFFVMFSVLILVLPLFKLDFTYFKEDYIHQNTSYVYLVCIFYWFPIIMLLILIFFKAQNIIYSLITETKIKKITNPQLRLMTILQIGFIMVAGILFLIAPYFNIYEKISPYVEIPDNNSVTYTVLNIVGFIFLSFNILYFIVFIIKNKKNVKPLLLPGIRNMLLTIPCLLLTLVHKCNYHSGDVTIFTHKIVIGDYILYEYWSEQYI